MFTNRMIRDWKWPALRRSSTRRSRVVRSFSAAIIVLVAGTFALQRTIDRSYGFHDPPFAAKFEKLQATVRENPGRPLVLIAGSSRTEVGFDGVLAEARMANSYHGNNPCLFNFGFAGAGPVIHSVYLERLIESGIVPNAVIFETMTRLIQDEPEGPAELYWLSPDRFLEKECNNLQRRFGGKTNQWLAKNKNPWRTSSPRLLYQVAPSFVSPSLMGSWERAYNARGWIPLIRSDLDSNTREAMSKRAELEYRAHLSTAAPGGLSAECFRRCVERCRELNIPVRILLMPEATTFRSWYGPGANDRFLTFLHSFDVPIIDARTWIDDSGFADGHHLYSNGVPEFTNRFTDDALVPLIRELKR